MKKKPADRAREKKRKAAKAKAVQRQANGAELDLATQLAAAMRIYDDTKTAAAWIGLDPGADLKRLEQLARERHRPLIDGSKHALIERLEVAMVLLTQAAIKHREEVAPRDLPHVLRAIGQARQLVTDASEESRFANVTVTVVGADGAPVDVG